MRRSLGTVLALSVCATTASAQDSEPPDFTNPANVVTAIFEAARTGDPSMLPALCPPEGGNDGDTRAICTMTTDHEDWEEFVSWFSKGKLSGEVTITDDRANVPFLFGPDGTRAEEMRLVRIDGRWYLGSF